MIAYSNNTHAQVFHNIKDGNKAVFSEGTSVNFLKVFNQSHKIGTWDYRIKDGNVFWSPEVYEIHGLMPSERPVDVKRAVAFYHPEDARTINDLLEKAIRMKSGFCCKLRVKRNDGTIRITESNGAPVLDNAGDVIRMIGTFRDITSQVEFENTRRSQTDLLVRTIKCMPVAAALLDRQCRYITLSARWLSDFNLQENAEYIGRSHRDVMADLAAHQHDHLELALRGTPVGKDNDRFARTNGVTLISDWRMQPWHGKTGEVAGVLVLMHVKYTGAPRVGRLDQPDILAPLASLATLITAPNEP